MRAALLFALALAGAAPAAAQLPREVYSCERPELWLAHVAHAELPAAYCAACGDRCDEGRMPWSLLERPDALACRELQYASLAIGAALGERIRDPAWRAYFTAQPWYRVRRYRARPARWTAVARGNQRWLDAMGRRCREARPEVPARVRRLVERWFAALAEGRPSIPARVFVGGGPSTRAEVRELLRTPEMFRFTQRTPVVPTPLEHALGGPGTVSVLTSVPSISCVIADSEDCEGYEALELTFDARGRLTALHAFFAACPHVYVVDAGGARRVGEILVRRNRASLAGVDSLSLGAERCTGRTLEVELREEEPETTFLEGVWLEVDGVRVDPAEPVRPRVLRRGDVLVLRFEVPPACGALQLVARGHYEPG